MHISNSPVKPDQNIWIEKLELYCTDKAILESSAKWLNDNIVCSAQNLLSKQSQGRIIGWQHTQCAKTAFSALPAKATFIQILHVSGCHWIMVSNVNPKGGAFHDSVGIYDSRHTRFGQSSIGSSLLELSTGVQTVREFPNTRKRQAIKRNIYFNGKFANPGSPKHPKRDVTVEIVIKFH